MYVLSVIQNKNDDLSFVATQSKNDLWGDKYTKIKQLSISYWLTLSAKHKSDPKKNQGAMMFFF